MQLFGQQQRHVGDATLPSESLGHGPKSDPTDAPDRFAFVGPNSLFTDLAGVVKFIESQKEIRLIPTDKVREAAKEEDAKRAMDEWIDSVAELGRRQEVATSAARKALEQMGFFPIRQRDLFEYGGRTLFDPEANAPGEDEL